MEGLAQIINIHSRLTTETDAGTGTDRARFWGDLSSVVHKPIATILRLVYV